MTTPKTPSVTFCALLLIATACGSNGEEPQPGNRARMLEPPPQPLTAEGMVTDEHQADPQLQPIVQMALQDLATMLNAKPETIDVIKVGYVTWPDSSLGCPRPDYEYMQVLTDGVRIVLGHGGASYHYHGSREGRPFYCEQPRKPIAGQSNEATS